MKFNKGLEIIFLNFIISGITILSIFSSIGYEIEKQKSQDFPEIIKGIYLTSWSASNERSIQRAIEIAKTTKINAVIIDIKDYSGNVFYKTDIPEVKNYGAERIFIPDIKGFIERFHNEGIAVIARLTVFQDPILAKARPDLAIKSKNGGELWLDRQNLAWTDPASKEAWEYNVKIAQDAFNKGFDEVNFDYVRFPSDGNLSDMVFPFWDEKKPKNEVINNLFIYIRENLPGKRISVDLFGLTTVNYDHLGIGQIIEDSFENFDYISPMIYPSHYASGFQGFKNPAEHPYEVIYYSLKKTQERLDDFNKKREVPVNTKIRPWLQDFNLGATYDAEMIRKQIQATKDALGDNYKGFMLWNPRNIYTIDGL